MAQTCSVDASINENFEFIDCSSINISYISRGIATISLSIVSTYDHIYGNYNYLTFGGVNYSLIIKEVQVSKIPGTLVNIFSLSMTGFGC